MGNSQAHALSALLRLPLLSRGMLVHLTLLGEHPAHPPGFGCSLDSSMTPGKGLKTWKVLNKY